MINISVKRLINPLFKMKNLFCITLIILFFGSCNQNGQQTADHDLKSGLDSAARKKLIHCGPKTTDKDWYSSGTKAPRFGLLRFLFIQIPWM